MTMRGVREVGGREDGRGQRDRSNRWRTRFERENQAERQKQRELEDGDKQIDQRIYKDLKGESLRCERHMRKGKEQRRGQGGRGEEGRGEGFPLEEKSLQDERRGGWRTGRQRSTFHRGVGARELAIASIPASERMRERTRVCGVNE